jgi:hypothetical protein
MRAAPMIPILAAALATSCVLAGQGVPAAGGFRKVAVTDERVVAAAKFAVEDRGRKEKVTLVKVLEAEAQVVAGMNYRLLLEVRVDGGTRQAEAVVWAKLDGTHRLTQWDWKGEVRPGEPDGGGTRDRGGRSP